MIEKEHGWEVGSGLPSQEPLDEQIEALLERTRPIANRIRLLSERHVVQVSCIAYSDNVPSITLSKGVIQAVNELGASIDIDLYVSAANWTD